MSDERLAGGLLKVPIFYGMSFWLHTENNQESWQQIVLKTALQT